jgi:preprotein translocase subunit SecD
VIAAPVIADPITGGRGEIPGYFTSESANALAIQLRCGVLPVSYAVVEVREVEPGPARR